MRVHALRIWFILHIWSTYSLSSFETLIHMLKIKIETSQLLYKYFWKIRSVIKNASYGYLSFKFSKYFDKSIYVHITWKLAMWFGNVLPKYNCTYTRNNTDLLALEILSVWHGMFFLNLCWLLLFNFCLCECKSYLLDNLYIFSR